MKSEQIDWMSQPVGLISDRVLAKQLGVGLRYVEKHHTRKRNIYADMLFEHINPAHICRDDRCECTEIHPKHLVRRDTFNLFHDKRYRKFKAERHGDTLNEIVLKHIERRRCKPFRELYDDMINDYGTFASKGAGIRAMWRALSRLIDSGSITKISGKSPRSPSGYVRSDSPLLRDAEGQSSLLSTLLDDDFPQTE